jgi:hypothetical protein
MNQHTQTLKAHRRLSIVQQRHRLVPALPRPQRRERHVPRAQLDLRTELGVAAAAKGVAGGQQRAAPGRQHPLVCHQPEIALRLDDAHHLDGAAVVLAVLGRPERHFQGAAGAGPQLQGLREGLEYGGLQLLLPLLLRRGRAAGLKATAPAALLRRRRPFGCCCRNRRVLPGRDARKHRQLGGRPISHRDRPRLRGRQAGAGPKVHPVVAQLECVGWVLPLEQQLPRVWTHHSHVAAGLHRLGCSSCSDCPCGNQAGRQRTAAAVPHPNRRRRRGPGRIRSGRLLVARGQRRRGAGAGAGEVCADVGVGHGRRAALVVVGGAEHIERDGGGVLWGRGMYDSTHGLECVFNAAGPAHDPNTPKATAHLDNAGEPPPVVGGRRGRKRHPRVPHRPRRHHAPRPAQREHAAAVVPELVRGRHL